MNGVDYSTRAAANREYYQDSVDKLKKSHDEELDQISKQSENRAENQKKVYLAQKEQLEQENEKFNSQASTKTKEQIDQQKQDFFARNKNMQEDFEKETSRLRTDFNNRLDSARTSYDSSLASEKDRYQQSTDWQSEKNSGRIKELSAKQQAEIDQIESRSEQALDNNKKSLKLEKLAFQNKSQAEKELMLKNANQRLYTTKDDLMNKITLNDKIAKDQFTQVEKKQQNDLETLRATNGVNQAQARLANENRLEKLQERSLSEMSQMSKDRIINEARLKNENREALANERRRIDGMTKGVDGKSREQNDRDKLEQGYGRRLSNLTNQMQDLDRKYQAESAVTKSSYNQIMRDKSDVHRDEVLTMNSDYDELSRGLQKKSDDRYQEMVGDFRRKIREDRNVWNQAISEEKKSSKALLNNQKKYFGETIAQVQEKEIDSIQKVQNVSRNEKSQIINRAVEHQNAMREDLLAEQNRKLTNLTEVYETKLDQKNEVMDKIINQYEDKVSLLQERMDEMMNVYLDDLKTVKIENDKSNKETAKFIHDEYKTTISEMKNRFQSELAATKSEHDIFVNNLSRRNEIEKKEMIRGYESDIKKKTEALEKEYKVFAKSSEQEKKIIRDNYEKQIESIKLAHNEERDALKNRA